MITISRKLEIILPLPFIKCITYTGFKKKILFVCGNLFIFPHRSPLNKQWLMVSQLAQHQVTNTQYKQLCIHHEASDAEKASKNKNCVLLGPYCWLFGAIQH